MRRFSQKNALVTLADINVTPLLDLAFVLLIIFVITTPLLEQNVQLQLPKGGRADEEKLTRADIRTVEVDKDGGLKLEGQTLSLDEMEAALVEASRQNPKLVINIRGDRRAAWGPIASLLDRCEQKGLTRIRARMFPEH